MLVLAVVEVAADFWDAIAAVEAAPAVSFFTSGDGNELVAAATKSCASPAGVAGMAAVIPGSADWDLTAAGTFAGCAGAGTDGALETAGLAGSTAIGGVDGALACPAFGCETPGVGLAANREMDTTQIATKIQRAITLFFITLSLLQKYLRLQPFYALSVPWGYFETQ